MKKFTTVLLLLFTLTVLPIFADEQRIAVVDMAKIFQEYYKSKIAEDFISQKAEAARKYLEQLKKQLEAAQNKARNLGSDALNPAYSDSEREKIKQEAAIAIKDAKAKEAEITLYMQEQSTQLQKLENTRRAEIIQDIKNAIKKRAILSGYSFVLDSSGNTTNNIPTIIYCKPQIDLTATIIADLNRTASTKRE